LPRREFCRMYPRAAICADNTGHIDPLKAACDIHKGYDVVKLVGYAATGVFDFGTSDAVILGGCGIYDIPHS
jgi:hypothetical protein